VALGWATGGVLVAVRAATGAKRRGHACEHAVADDRGGQRKGRLGAGRLAPALFTWVAAVLKTADALMTLKAGRKLPAQLETPSGTDQLLRSKSSNS
jgi:hypothetical protein